MKNVEEMLMAWLRDAHAMEEQAEEMLRTTAARLPRHPAFRDRVLAHLDETRREGEQLRECILRRGGDTATLKDVAARITPVAQALSGMFAADEVAEAARSTYTFEHMEIATYRTLIAAARHVADAQTQRVCETILLDEEAMATWLLKRLPSITEQSVMLGAAGPTAGG